MPRVPSAAIKNTCLTVYIVLLGFFLPDLRIMGEPALAGWLEQMIPRGPFQPLPLSHSENRNLCSLAVKDQVVSPVLSPHCC